MRIIATTANDPCKGWVDSFRGRVGRSGGGSFAVWTKRTPSSLALVIGALHSLGRGAFAPENTAVTQKLAPPNPEAGALRLVIPKADGSFAAPLRAVAFHLFHPAVSANENTATFANLRPRNDFYVDVMDGQRFPTDELAEPLPSALQSGPVPLYDPSSLTTSAPTFGSPAAGDVVAYAGFPRTGPFAQDGAVGFARVLSDAEATAAISALAAAGDEEGMMPYDKEAEMLLAGEGFVGMSGGGVFDRSGRLVGTLVRASSKAPKYVRAVRTSFIAARIAQAASGVTSVASYLPTP
jgi:hypothetical protein